MLGAVNGVVDSRDTEYGLEQTSLNALAGLQEQLFAQLLVTTAPQMASVNFDTNSEDE